MRRAVVVPIVVGIVSLIIIVYSLYSVYRPVFVGLNEYSPEKVHSVLVEHYANVDDLAHSSSQLWFMNFLYYNVLLKVPYSYERAGSPEVFLSRGGDCFDFAFFILGIYRYYYPGGKAWLLRMNIRFSDGRVEGHVAPVIVLDGKYCIIDVPMQVFVCGPSKSMVVGDYSSALSSEGITIVKSILIPVPQKPL